MFYLSAQRYQSAKNPRQRKLLEKTGNRTQHSYSDRFLDILNIVNKKF